MHIIRRSYSEPLGIPTKSLHPFSTFLLLASCNVHSVLVLMILIQIIIHIILSVRSTYSAEYSFSLYSSRRVRPNFALIKTTGKVIIMCNQIFKLRDIKTGKPRFKTRSYQAFPHSSIDFLLNVILICYLRSQIPG